MAIVYCSWATGNDTTGTGTAAAPWKTIDKATASRTAGDEVRVAKSPEPTALTGTTAWTLGGTTVTGTGTLFTAELVIGDFISAPDGQFYEVITLGSDTSATLYKKYPSSSASGHSSTKLGVTDTGEAAATGTNVQTISSSGSASAYLYISGGWDLSTQTQTGQTYFRQMHSSFANRYGNGLTSSNKNYTDISRLHFLRYNNGMSVSGNYCVTNSPVCCSCNTGIYFIQSNSVINTPICNSNNVIGIWIEQNQNNIINSPICNSNGAHGIYLFTNSNHHTVVSPFCKYNVNSGIAFYSAFNNVIVSPTLVSNATGINLLNHSSNVTILGTLTTSGHTTPISCTNGFINIAKASIAESTKAGGFSNLTDGQVRINDMGGQSYIYTDNGNIVTQNATAGGTGREWKFSPTNAIRNSVYPLWLPMARFAVASSGQVTITAYFKKSGTGVAGALRCRYGQVTWSDAAQDIVVNCPDNTSRNQVTLQFTPTEAGVVEIEALAWYVSSTSQTVIVDDIAVSQA